MYQLLIAIILQFKQESLKLRCCIEADIVRDFKLASKPLLVKDVFSRSFFIHSKMSNICYCDTYPSKHFHG